MSIEQARLILGLASDVVPDDVLATAYGLAEEWVARKAASYSVAPPNSAVVMMTIYFLRTHLDLAGIKPSSLNLPDLAMSTDMVSASRLLMETAEKDIKDAAFANGAAFRHIRSGKVGRWQ